jgi:hypothetical protein
MGFTGWILSTNNKYLIFNYLIRLLLIVHAACESPKRGMFLLSPLSFPFRIRLYPMRIHKMRNSGGSNSLEYDGIDRVTGLGADRVVGYGLRHFLIVFSQI